jgi:fimbrial chaperone protein
MLQRAMSQAAFGLAFFLIAGGVARAGSFAVDPVRATLSAARPVVSFVVRNDGAEDTVVQLGIVAWSQQDGIDQYSATREILATPPIFKVPARGRQIVRLGLRRDPDPQRELTYRLFLEEVPPPLKEGFRGLRVTLRIAIPVFVVPAASTAPALRWTATRTPQGEINLALTNGGNAHIQIAAMSVAVAEQSPSKFTEPVYVLPGQSRVWVLGTRAKPGAPVRLVAKTDRGDMRADIVVAER